MHKTFAFIGCLLCTGAIAQTAAPTLDADQWARRLEDGGRGTTIGYKRILRVEPVMAVRVRVNLTDGVSP